MTAFTRRALFAAPLLLMSGFAGAAAPTPITVYKTESCGCCGGWITHMRRAGFATTVVVVDEVATPALKRGVPFELGSCHLADVGGYVVVGHVPSADVRRLLAERPRAIGITVPGMPVGSPGMEHPRGLTERYQTLLLLPGGRTRVFAAHG
jgi:hypothetical protein